MTSWTIDVGLGRPDYGDRSWHVPLWAVIDALEANRALKDCLVTLPLDDRPANDGSPPVSARLQVRVAAGTLRGGDGSYKDVVAIPNLDVPAGGVSYLYYNDATPPVIQVAPAWPTAGFGYYTRLARVTTDATTVVDIEDFRRTLSGGTI